MAILVRNEPICDPLKITTVHPRDYRGFPIRDCTYKNVGGQSRDVAVHATDYSNHTIKVFKPDGTESQIGSSDNNGGQFSRPWGITLIDDTIYIVSHSDHTIAMYLINGRFIGSFGGNGTDNGQLSNPRGICTDGKGRLLVADYGNKRIQVFTSQGNFINSIPCSTGPFHVAVDRVGNIHIPISDNHHIAVYGSHNYQTPIEKYNLGGILSYGFHSEQQPIEIVNFSIVIGITVNSINNILCISTSDHHYLIQFIIITIAVAVFNQIWSKHETCLV